MIQRYFFGVLAIAILSVSAAVTTVGQVGELRGHVWMQQADGQKVPLADATIDVYRIDVTAKYNTKTNKKGEFVFAGLPFVGNYTVAASHATAQPNFVTGVKVGREIMCEITLIPGDGSRLTFEEIKTSSPKNPAATSGSTSSSSSGGGESAAEKAKREELIKKNKEIEESNKKITEANAVIGRTFKAGNDALNAAMAATKANNSTEALAKYTEAINQYNEGLAADPEQAALLTNRALAFKGRAIERYNSSIKLPADDQAGRKAALDSAQEDFKAAADSSTKAVELLKKTPAATDPAEVARQNANKYFAFVTHSDAMRLLATKVDPTQADAALQAFKDYISVETDPVKKAKAQLDAAQMLLDAGSADKALAEYQSILATQPDSPDANLGAGLALYAMNDKAKFQEAANYLQHFVDVAPDSNQFKGPAKEILTELKNTQNVVPEKTATPKRKRP